MTMMENFGSGWHVRPEETPLRTAAQIAESEAARQSKRPTLHRKRAEALVAGELHAELTSAMADCEAKKESLASQHVADCAPLQAELAEIDRQQLDAAVAKAPRDPELSTRRAHLADQIRQRNADLELAIDTENRLLASLFVERREAGMKSGVANIESELVQSASTALRFAVRIWASKCGAAAARVHAIQDGISRSGRTDEYSKALLEDARAELTRCQDASAAAIKAAIEEP